MTIPIFIGFDPREDEAWRVCYHSIQKHASVAVDIMPLRMEALRWAGLYRRAPKPGTHIDSVDSKPFSTDFSFTRFLVPALRQYHGWAIFVDCDFLFGEDIANLWAKRDNRYAVMGVKHDYKPMETVKMDGQPQEQYANKNWSSLMLWNCAHLSNLALTPDVVANRPGYFLHRFGWLARASEIGEIPHRWNILNGPGCATCEEWKEVGQPVRDVTTGAHHFTRGGPWLEDPPPEGMGVESWAEIEYAQRWMDERDEMKAAKEEGPKTNGEDAEAEAAAP